MNCALFLSRAGSGVGRGPEPVSARDGRLADGSGGLLQVSDSFPFVVVVGEPARPVKHGQFALP
jgi:hypothetical protein